MKTKKLCNSTKDNVTGEIAIDFYCDGVGEDIFSFKILTGLTDADIAKLTKIGKTIRKEIALKLVERKSEEEAIRETDNEWKRHFQNQY